MAGSRWGRGEVYARGRIFWIRFSRHGRQHAESSRSTSRADAVLLLTQRLADLGSDPSRLRITVSDALDLVITDYRANRRRSLDAVERRVTRHLRPFFGATRKLIQLSDGDVRRYVLDRQRAGAENATINRECAILRRAFRLARVPSPTIALLRENNVRRGFFDAPDLARVLAQLPAAVRPAIQFAARTGWRVSSEVLPLTWRQVDFAAGEVRLDAGTTKNGDARVFPLTDELRALLRAQRTSAARWKTPYVFHRQGQPIRSLRRAWTTACRRAGCPDMLPHDLRRSAVRALVRATVPERVAMQMTGHKTRSVFERYNIVSPDDLRVAADRLNAASA
jgi:integrase